jgi:glycosyltransferase involved in cell wall biosynthesis
MKIAHFSPVPPDRTGIADYCLELLPELARHAEVDLWVEQGRVASPPEGCGLVEWGEPPRFTERLSPYDATVYHFGNSKYHRGLYRAFLEYPGTVVMHDFVLHHFFAECFLESAPEKYLEEMRYNYSSMGKAMAQDILAGRLAPLWETQPMQFPLNKRILDLATGVIVHSEFARGLVLQSHPHLPVRKINLPVTEMNNDENVEHLKMRYDIPLDRVVLASFGMGTPHKRIETILRAIGRLQPGNVVYLLVGELTARIERVVKEAGLEDVVRSTGYLDRKGFEDYCALADICVNLRFPTYGETSASVCKLMGAAKACVVSDIGWFSELPDNCVAKVDVDEFEEETLLACLERLVGSAALRATMGANAREFIRANHSLPGAASQYIEFLREVNEHSQKRRFDSRLVEEIAGLIARLGITDEDLYLIERPAEILAQLL